MSVCIRSAGAVAAALDVIEDLLLQFSPLLLFLGDVRRGRGPLCTVTVQHFAVLGLPEVPVQTPGGVQEGVMIAPLDHLPLKTTTQRRRS